MSPDVSIVNHKIQSIIFDAKLSLFCEQILAAVTFFNDNKIQSDTKVHSTLIFVNSSLLELQGSVVLAILNVKN
jgi:hypothetical protein